MGKIINIEEAIRLSKKLRQQGKTIVLAGGCFDLLHIGHLLFLEKAKKQGDFLFVLLVSDETIKRLKGNHRPINTQKDRAKLLAALTPVDYVVYLSGIETNKDYDSLICKLKPNIIAVTKGDPNKFHKERQASLTKAKLIEVVQMVSDKSTSRLAKLISRDL